MLLLTLSVQADLPNPLRVVISNDTYPYMYTDEHDQPAGLIADYWQEVARRQNVQLQLIPADWPATIQLLEQGKVHVHGAMAYTPQRASAYQLGKTNLFAYSNVFVHRDLPTLRAIQQLRPYRLGIVENSGHISAINEAIPDSSQVYFPNNTALYNAALHGDIKVFAGLDKLATTYPRYKELSRLFPLYKKIPLRRIELVYAVAGDENLTEQLQQAVAELDSAFIDKLERRWLSADAADDVLLVGVSINNQPFMQVSSQGEAQGLFVDLWRLWSEKTNVKVAFVPDTSHNLMLSLRQGRIDVVMGHPADDSLPADITRAYHLYSFSSLFYFPQQRPVTSMMQLSGQRVGVFQTSSYKTELQQRYPDIEFVSYTTFEDMVNGVFAGDLAGFYSAEATTAMRLQQLDLWDDFAALDGTAVQSALYSLTRADKPALAEQINNGFAQLTLDEMETIEAQWINQEYQRYFSLFRDKVPLTNTEQQWIDKHGPFRVAIIDNWAPMEFVDSANNPSGVTIDILALLTQRTGLKFVIKPYAEFDSMMQALRDKEIDMVANVSDTAERQVYANFTDEFWSIQWSLISLVSAEDINSSAALAGKKVAILRDYQLVKHLASHVPGAEIVSITNLLEGLELLQQNQVDYVLDSVEAAGQTLRQSGLVNFRIQLIDDLPVFPSLIAVRDDYQPLVSVLNKGLRSIGQKERQQLYQKWFDFEITQGIDRQKFVRMMWQIAGAIVLLLLFFTIWNFSLRREVTLRHQAEQKMRFMATHDDLTQLPNRSLFIERTEQALLQHARHNEILALLFIDLDGFKEVNDQYGHETGDELLVKLSAVLPHTVRKSDTVARFGGDEFVVLLTGLLSRDDAAIIAEKILYQLKEPVTLSVGEVNIGASIGIALYPQDGTDCKTLLKVADSLMYRVKQHGKHSYCFTDTVF